MKAITCMVHIIYEQGKGTNIDTSTGFFALSMILCSRIVLVVVWRTDKIKKREGFSWQEKSNL